MLQLIMQVKKNTLLLSDLVEKSHNTILSKEALPVFFVLASDFFLILKIRRCWAFMLNN